MVERIMEMTSENLNIDRALIQPTSSFKGDLGIDSLDITEIIMSVEDAFGITVEVSSQLACVSDLAAKIEELTANG